MENLNNRIFTNSEQFILNNDYSAIAKNDFLTKFDSIFRHVKAVHYKDYTIDSWEQFRLGYDNILRILSEGAYGFCLCNELNKLMNMLELKPDLESYQLDTFDEGSKSQRCPFTATLGEVNDDEYCNLSVPKGKGFHLDTKTYNNISKAVASYSLATPVSNKVLGFYFRDMRPSFEGDLSTILLEVKDTTTGNGVAIINSTPLGSYLVHPIVKGEYQEPIDSETRRRTDWHKMEYNFTNYGVCEVYMDERLLCQLDNFSSFDSVVISRYNKEGNPSTLTVDNLMICDANHFTSIELPQKDVTLGYFDTYDINMNNYKAVVADASYPTTDKIKYYSDDETIARVSNEGTVECTSFGTTKVRLETSAGLTDEITVHCKDIKVEDIKISSSPIILQPNFVETITLLPNTKQVLNAIISPKGVTNRNVIWTTSNESVATVVDGLVCVTDVTGEAVITATTVDGNKSVSCTVVVCNNHTYGKELFVALNGSDSLGDGSLEKPFATIEKARDTIAEIKATTGLPVGGVVVYVRGGLYEITKGIEFTSQHSGSELSPICYMAYPNEEVTFAGSINFLAKDMVKVTDKDTLYKLPDCAKGKVYEFDLSNKINKFKDLQYTGHAKMSLTWLEEQGKNLHNAYYSVMFGGVGQTLARWPNEGEEIYSDIFKGFTPITKIYRTGAYPRMWMDDIIGRSEWVTPDKRDKRDLFAIESANLTQRIKNWKGFAFDQILCEDGKVLNPSNNPWAMGYWGANFSDQSIPLHSIFSDGVVIGDEPSGYTIKNADWARFYVYNLIQELDIEGEWYFDQSTFKLYLFPPKDSDMTSDTLVQFTVLANDMFSFKGASNITIDSIGMSAMLGSAVSLDNCNLVDIRNCSINGTQKQVGVIADNCKNCGFSYCKMTDVNGGILLNGGNKSTLEKGLNYVVGCYFNNFSTMTKTYNPAVFITGVGNIVSHCDMEQSPHAGIIYYGNEHLMEFCDIHDVVLEAADQGAIYTGANVSDRGCVIRNCYIHNVPASGTTENHGIYLDGNTGGLYIYDNVFDDMTNGIFVNGSRDTIMVGNKFANVERGVYISDCAYMEVQAWYKHGYGLFSNTFDDEPMDYDLTDPNTPYKKYEHLVTQANDNMLAAKYNKAIDNVLTDGKGNLVDTMSRGAQKDADAIIKDGCFIKNNITL